LSTISPASSACTLPWHDHPPVVAWERLLWNFADLFRRPSFQLFLTLISAWPLCPGRRTVTRMITVADPDGEHAHDAYHRFLRAGQWSMARLWCRLTLLLVASLDLPKELRLHGDDTLFHKSGRKVKGAGSFRDPIRSRGQKTVYAWGLNLVVLTVEVRPPWGGEPLALPVDVRLYKKGGPSHLDLMLAMVEEVAAWLPDHTFVLSCDGAYASLAGRVLPRAHLISRMRKDAALFDQAPERRPGQRGRPRKKGERLPRLEEIALSVPANEWSDVLVDVRGERVRRLLWALPVIWYAVCPDRPLLLVIVRDPDGKQVDDFFFSTNLAMWPEAVASAYAGRWSIEDTNRNVKQFLGAENPQCWAHDGPARAAALSLWTYSAVWLWYLACHDALPAWKTRPWYTAKRTPSFADALAGLRRALWTGRIFDGSESPPLLAKMPELLMDTLAEAA
jgi:hypothetical protein